MKTRLTSTATALAAALVCVGGSYAQEKGKEAGSYPALLAASEIKGATVKNLQNQEIGDIDELLIEPNHPQRFRIRRLSQGFDLCDLVFFNEAVERLVELSL